MPVVDLGGFVLTQPKASLELSCSTSMRLISLSHEESSVNAGSLTAAEVENDWVTFHHYFRFVVDFESVPCEAVNQLSSEIERAKLWSQLGLRAELETDQVSALQHSLAHQIYSNADPSSTPPLRRRHHSLPVENNVYDVEPHAGVRKWKVAEVNIVLALTEPLSNNAAQPNASSSDLVFRDDDIKLDDDEGVSHYPLILTARFEAAASDEHVPDMLEPSEDADSYQSNPVGNSMGSLPLKTRPTPSLSSIVSIIRTAICASISKGSTPGTQHHLVRDGRLSTLDRVAPSIWSPGFCAGISERACLLSTITHCLSRAISRGIPSSCKGEHESSIHSSMHQRVGFLAWEMLQSTTVKASVAAPLRATLSTLTDNSQERDHDDQTLSHPAALLCEENLLDDHVLDRESSTGDSSFTSSPRIGEAGADYEDASTDLEELLLSQNHDGHSYGAPYVSMGCATSLESPQEESNFHQHHAIDPKDWEADEPLLCNDQGRSPDFLDAVCRDQTLLTKGSISGRHILIECSDLPMESVSSIFDYDGLSKIEGADDETPRLGNGIQSELDIMFEPWIYDAIASPQSSSGFSPNLLASPSPDIMANFALEPPPDCDLAKIDDVVELDDPESILLEPTGDSSTFDDATDGFEISRLEPSPLDHLFWNVGGVPVVSPAKASKVELSKKH